MEVSRRVSQRRDRVLVAIESPWPGVAAWCIKMSTYWKFAHFAFLVMVFVNSCSQSPSYLGFVGRDQGFYERVADACDELRTNTPAGFADGSRITAHRLLLPEAIRDLHPDYLRVATNRIFISIGVGRGSYGIAWQPAGVSSWELRTYAESLERVLLTRAR